MNFDEYKKSIEDILQENKQYFNEFKKYEDYKKSLSEDKRNGHYTTAEKLDDINDAFLEIGMSLHLANKELNSNEYNNLKNFVLSEVSSNKSPANLNKVIKIAGHEGIQKHKEKLPKGWGTLAIISQLKENEFDLFINNEQVNPNLPRSVISSLVKECQGKTIIKKITVEVDLRSNNQESRENIIAILQKLNLESKGWKINLHDKKNNTTNTNNENLVSDVINNEKNILPKNNIDNKPS